MNAQMSKPTLSSADRAGPDYRPLLLGIGGTFRDQSSTERALDIALSAAEQAGARIARIVSKQLALPLYDPAVKDRSPDSERLVTLLNRCDGLIVASPSYHGSISGSIKNALDYSEDMCANDAPYLEGKAVGCIGCGAGWQGAVGALNALRSIAHALRAWPTPLGVAINTTQPVFDADGNCTDARLFAQLQVVGQQVVAFAYAQRSLRELEMPPTENITRTTAGCLS
jgi:FMN reductase